eukprot:180137-Pelagomonas_calceolata.AAC.3
MLQVPYFKPTANAHTSRSSPLHMQGHHARTSRACLYCLLGGGRAQVIHSKGRAVLALPWKPRSCAPHAAVANGGCCRACQDGRLVTCNAS